MFRTNGTPSRRDTLDRGIYSRDEWSSGTTRQFQGMHCLSLQIKMNVSLSPAVGKLRCPVETPRAHFKLPEVVLATGSVIPPPPLDELGKQTLDAQKKEGVYGGKRASGLRLSREYRILDAAREVWCPQRPNQAASI